MKRKRIASSLGAGLALAGALTPSLTPTAAAAPVAPPAPTPPKTITYGVPATQSTETPLDRAVPAEGLKSITGTRKITDPVDPRTLAPGANTQAINQCNAYQPPGQNYQMYPLIGCSFVPPMNGWRNQFCLGGLPYEYDCREILGHPDFGYYGNENWRVYKKTLAGASEIVSGYTNHYGRSLVNTKGARYLGCHEQGTWDAAAGDYYTTCDYKVLKSSPRRTESGDGYEYQILKEWASGTWNGEVKCAANVTAFWAYKPSIYTVAEACRTVVR